MSCIDPLSYPTAVFGRLHKSFDMPDRAMCSAVTPIAKYDVQSHVFNC